MLRLASDADITRAIVRGLRKREPTLNVVRVQEVGLRTATDPVILEWAANEGRILFTRDHDTMIGYAYDRVPICQTEDDLKDLVVFLPI